MLRILLLVLIGSVIACGGNKDENIKKAEVQKHKVSFVNVQKEQLPVYREFSGTVSAEDMVAITPKVIGYITNINYKEGMRFKKGAVLFEVSSQEIQEKLKLAESYVAEADNAIEQSKIGLKIAEEQLRQANAQYELAEKTYKRYQNLLKNESISKQEFDQVEAQYKMAKEAKASAESGVNLAKERMNQANVKKNQALAGKGEASVYAGYTKVIAPFDGIVLEKLVDVGNLAAPGQPVLKIGSNRNVIYSYVPESAIGKVKVGDELFIKVDSVGKSFKSKIVEISPNVDPMTRNFKIKSSAIDDIPVGAYTVALFADGNKESIMVPKSAVTMRGQLSVVFVNVGGKADMRIVKTGDAIGDKVEIISGLNGGEKIVEKNTDNIKSGDLLEG
ncbi:MAG: efflux RND transporter periplasmic adaptor subunit [Calditerrivibrio sp.]|nr:efflux RND transporter periplasmic adaptor subunit [Calditerrivibrio sp.]MCA1932539.1 efflux RND transporter periplasmic adaptor subunit [Calditerrivibrio sp.]MCA1980364.1 efflux RND transporter periplasmic adaptor subunit [Calditerrivibrio sp.]